MGDDALDIINTLLGNEKKKSPKEKVFLEPIKVVEVDNEIDDEPRARRGKGLTLTYVTPEEFEKLGSPKFGYTTARTASFGKSRPAEYYDVLAEYYRMAIKRVKLTQTIGWYGYLNPYNLDLCKKELENFRIENKLTVGDINEITQISHFYEHDRRKLVARLNEVVRMGTKKTADIPVNVRPTLKYVQEVIVEEDVVSEKSVTDILKDELTHGCVEHIGYRGLRIPRNGCKKCMSLYDYNKAHGIKETREYD
jgi:hypothetical protein